MALSWLRRDTGRLAGIAALVAGTGLAFVLQLVSPVRVPLYDGVPVVEPYRYLHPTGSQPGEPMSFSQDFPLDGNQSPAVPAFTGENPPQAQLVAQKGAFVLGSGSTAVHITITAVEPPGAPPDGQLAGNVYRFAVTDQAGSPLAIRTCDGCISLSLRAPDGIGAARLQRFSSGAWVDAETSHALGLYSTNPVSLGEYAIVTGGSGGSGDDGGLVLGLPFDQVVVAGGAAVILVVLFAAALLVRRRDPAPAPVRSRAIPSKHKKPRSRPGQGPGRPER
jgi:hypothetical protein